MIIFGVNKLYSDIVTAIFHYFQTFYSLNNLSITGSSLCLSVCPPIISAAVHLIVFTLGRCVSGNAVSSVKFFEWAGRLLEAEQSSRSEQARFKRALDYLINKKTISKLIVMKIIVSCSPTWHWCGLSPEMTLLLRVVHFLSPLRLHVADAHIMWGCQQLCNQQRDLSHAPLLFSASCENLHS